MLEKFKEIYTVEVEDNKIRFGIVPHNRKYRFFPYKSLTLNKEEALELVGYLYELVESIPDEKTSDTFISVDFKLGDSPIADLNLNTNGMVKKLVERMKTDPEFRKSVENTILDIDQEENHE